MRVVLSLVLSSDFAIENLEDPLLSIVKNQRYRS